MPFLVLSGHAIKKKTLCTVCAIHVAKAEHDKVQNIRVDLFFVESNFSNNFDSLQFSSSVFFVLLSC